MKKITAVMLAIIIAVCSTLTVTASAVSEPLEKGSDLFETLTACDPEFVPGTLMEAESLPKFMYHFSAYQWLENTYPDHGVLTEQLNTVTAKLRDCDLSEELTFTPEEWATLAAYITTHYGERKYLSYEPEDYANEFAAHYWVYEYSYGANEEPEDEILVMYMMTPTVFFLEYGHYTDGKPSMEIEKWTCFHLSGN